MTPKERIITAYRNLQPDAVPITTGCSEMVPVKRSGLNSIEYFWHEKRDLSRDRCDTDRFYGADIFIHSVEGPSPKDPSVTIKPVRLTSEEVVYEKIIHTASGDLKAVFQITPFESIGILKGCVDHPAQDFKKIMRLLENPDTKDFGKYMSDWNYAGDDGHCGLWIPTPVDWWSILRRSPEIAVYDFMDFSELMQDIFKEYTRYCVALVEAFLRNHLLMADSVGLGGSSTSMSVISPTIPQDHIVGFVGSIKAVTARYNVPLTYHMCGRSRQAISLLVEAGVDSMDALECPPTGDVDLGEVKRLFGSRISLRGNINTITTMLNGTPADVEKEVERCMKDGKAGGGYILGPGDQTPYNTPNENIFALVESGRKHGVYSSSGTGQ